MRNCSTESSVKKTTLSSDTEISDTTCMFLLQECCGERDPSHTGKV
jgi:hypothetical protein